MIKPHQIVSFILSVGLVISTTASYAAVNNPIVGQVAKKKLPVSAQKPTNNSTQKTEKTKKILNFINIDGYLRSYYFTRDFDRIPDQSAYSLGGKLNALTDPFWGGFRLGATLWTAQPLGLSPDKRIHQDRTLPNSPVTSLGQAFLQYQNKHLLVRGGDQLITTPWLNEADTRMIPAAYEGVYSDLSPINNLDFIVMRITAFKSRINDGFSQTNLYNLSNESIPILALGDKTNPGVLAGATKYKTDNFTVQAWDYQFYRFAELAYTDAKYVFPIDSRVRPLIGMQGAQEWAGGNNILERLGQGKVRATVFGVLTGVKVGDSQITFGYDNIPQRRGGFNNGDFVSPYTSGYTADPLYTTSMVIGLIERTAGSAFKFTNELFFLNKQIRFLTSYAKYHSEPFLPNTSETDVDVTYYPQGIFKNLSLRDRIGVVNGLAATGRFVYNRVQLQYNF